MRVLPAGIYIHTVLVRVWGTVLAHIDYSPNTKLMSGLLDHIPVPPVAHARPHTIPYIFIGDDLPERRKQSDGQPTTPHRKQAATRSPVRPCIGFVISFI
jgi:hypothetical protein